MSTYNTLVNSAPKALRAALIVGLGLGLLVIAAGLMAERDAGARADAVQDEATSHRALFDLHAGQVRVYDLYLEQKTNVSATGQRELVLDGGLKLRGRLELTTLEVDRAGTAKVELNIARVDEVTWSFLGQELPKDQAVEHLRAHRAVAEVAPTGRVTRIAFAPDTPRTYASVAATIINQLQPILAEDGTSWSGEITSALGQQRALWSVDACSASGCRYVSARSAQDYTSVTFMPVDKQEGTWRGAAKHSFEVNNEATLSRYDVSEELSLDGEGSVNLARVELDASLELVSAHDLEPSRLADRARAGLVGFEALANAARQNSLRSRLAGMTTEQMTQDLEAFGDGGRMPDHSRWMWRVVALLRHDPAAVDALEQQIFEMSETGQVLGVDLLANAGSPYAQQAMVRVLSDERVRARDDYAMVLQHTAIVREPEEDVARFLSRRAADTEDATVRRAATVALGGISSKLDEDRARGYIEGLREGLREAKDPRDRAALVMALGNAKDPKDVARIAPLARDESPIVRSSAVRALGSIESAEATDELVEALGGAEATRSTALHELRDKDLSATQLQAIAEVVGSGALGDNQLEVLRDVIAHGVSTGRLRPDEHVQALVELMWERAESPRIKQRISQTLTLVSVQN